MWLQVNEDSLLGRVEARATDLSAALGIDLDPKAGITEAQKTALRDYMGKHYDVGDANGEYPMTFGDITVLEELEHFIVMQYTVAGPLPPPDDLVIRYSGIMHAVEGHRGGFHFENNYRTGLVDNYNKLHSIHAPGRETAQLSLLGENRLERFMSFLWEGIYHIWIGIDHVLFLITLLLTAVMVRKESRWEPEPLLKTAAWNVLALVTLFTLAHSITLGMAMLKWVELPSRFVESVIALSIVIVVLDNFFGFLGRYKWLTVFVFGLFHGFGFATVLSDLAVGLGSLAVALVGFNVGVEVGQLAIVLVAFPILFVLRRWHYQKLILWPVSVVVGLLATWWFVERAFDLQSSWTSF
ncbi:MAG: HupE/UreJ family protein [Pseudomonadales bacterium]